MTAEPNSLYGVMAEFLTPEEATRAARSVYEQGFTQLDAYGPFPSAELAEAVGFRERKIAPCVLGGGIVGGLAGYALQYYATVIDYPHNIGGRPFNSWPSFIPATFETTVLGAVVTGILSLLVLSRLPRLSHPVFSAPHFEHATHDHFFLCVRPHDSTFSSDKAKEALDAFSPLSISILRHEDQS